MREWEHKVRSRTGTSRLPTRSGAQSSELEVEICEASMEGSAKGSGWGSTGDLIPGPRDYHPSEPKSDA